MQEGCFTCLRGMQFPLGWSQQSVQSWESSAGAVLGAAEPNLLPLQLSCLFEMHRQPGYSSRRIISIETNWDVVRGIMINSEGMLPQALFIF